jgi:hypothetical protein
MLAVVFTVDWEQVRLKRAISSLAAMLLAVLFAVSVGDIVLSAVMATLFVTGAGGDGTMSVRLPTMLRFTLYGAALGGLAFWSADTAWFVALVLGVATYVGTLASVVGPREARAGLFLTLWALMALTLGSENTEPWRVSVAFLAGGAMAMVVTAVRLRTSGADTTAQRKRPEPGVTRGEGIRSRLKRLKAAMTSPLGLFAVVRTTAVISAVLLGFWWFASYPMWIAITVVVVLQPPAHESLSVAVERTIGTALGVGLAVVVAQVLPRGDSAMVVAFLVSGVLMVAFMGANYTLFAAFLTAMLVFGQRLAQADFLEAGWERLLATAAGAVISFLIVTAIDTPTSKAGDSTPIDG